MHLWIRQCLIGSCLAVGMTAANAGSIDQIVAFGDSLSDNGNLYRNTQVLHAHHPSFDPIPGAPYWQGRFSDGPVWVEELLKKMRKTNRSISLLDYAMGGGTVQSDRISPLEILWPRHTSHDEIFTYLNEEAEKNTGSNNRHLYTFWMGANDYINLVNLPEPQPFDPEAETTAVITILKNDIKGLIQDVNAKQFLILNLPDLGRTPGAMFMGDDPAAALSQMTQLHNLKLQQAVEELQAQYPNVTFVQVNVFDAMNSLIDTQSWNGERVENVVFPCYGGMITANEAKAKMRQRARSKKFSVMMNTDRIVGDGVAACKNPREYLFWDWIHPTNRIHKMLADQAVVELAAKGIR